MLQGKTKTNKQDTVKSLTPDQDAANFFSKGLDKYFRLCWVRDLCDTSETLPRWDESSNRQEGNKWKHLKNISHKNTFYKALFTKAGVNLNLSWGSIQPGRTGLPTKTSFLPVTMLCCHAKAWEITFLGGTGYLMWYIWWEGPIHQKSPWCWQRLKAKGEEGVRGWDGWIASLTQGTWPWANSGG